MCPVCKSKNLGCNSRSNSLMGPGYRTWTVSYYCKDCGVVLNREVMEKKYPKLKDLKDDF